MCVCFSSNWAVDVLVIALAGDNKANTLPRAVWRDRLHSWWPAGARALPLLCVCTLKTASNKNQKERNFSYLVLALLSLTLQLLWTFRYQRSTSAISVGKLNLLLCPREFQVNCSTDHYDRSEHCYAYAVAPVYYAHLAAAQVRQFVKLDESSETGSSASGGPAPVPELPRLHKDVRSSMFFC